MNRELKFTLAVPGAIVGAWLAMLGLGIWHSANQHIPTIGYWPALLILLGIGISTETLANFSQTKKTSTTRRYYS